MLHRSMESKKSCSLSILMFPWLAHGHIYPYLELAKHLSTKNFTIFFCSTPINLTSIKESLKTTTVSINLIELDIPSTPELPPEYHTTKNVPPHLMPKLHHAFQQSRSSFSAIITSLKPDLLIYDVFQPWAAAFAASLSIPAVYFATTGAAAYSFYYHHFKNKNSAFPYDGLYLRTHEWKALQALALPRSGMIEEDDKNDGFSFFTKSSDVILMKTSRGIEGKYIDYLSDSCNKKIVAVGPLITLHTASFDDSHMMQWLGTKSPFSTVFISFGSENYLSRDQIESIAKGLEKSNVNFIWVLRNPPIKKVEALPEGFVDRMREKERGLIVEKWAPQTEILAHSSIGAFMSHCGMSSIVESVYFGVPIICMPLKLDQPLNARLMVEAGVAVEVVKDENGGFSSEELANAMNKIFVEKTGEDMRVRAAELSRKIRSEQECAVEETAEHLRRICMDHKLWN